MKKAAKILLIVMLSLIGLVLTLGGVAGGYYLYSRNNEEERASITPKEREIIYFGDEKYEAKKTVNYLAVGIDSTGELKKSNGYNNTSLNDFMCLISFNLTDETYVVIPLNRDTMVDIDVLGLTGKPVSQNNMQLAYAHTFGDGMEHSFENVVRAASRILLDLDIERYIGFNMSAIPIINDAVGGVTVTLEDDLTSIHSDWKKGETITLTGNNCLDYIRARMSVGDGTQLSRMRRQQQYIEAVIKTARTAEYDFSDVSHLLKMVSKHMCMDVTYIDMADLFIYVRSFKYLGIKKIEGSTTKNKGLIEFYPDQEKLEDLIKELFYTKVEDEEEVAQ